MDLDIISVSLSINSEAYEIYVPSFFMCIFTPTPAIPGAKYVSMLFSVFAGIIVSLSTNITYFVDAYFIPCTSAFFLPPFLLRYMNLPPFSSVIVLYGSRLESPTTIKSAPCNLSETMAFLKTSVSSLYTGIIIVVSEG
ncbi:MAG: hypothetical protein AMDU4_FER2C00102G0003 [Ferroplasma sp. Type II]|nr:MAG: hypothetical protein AMDU4_FER2C00102G0003 [Ferroplasma sp. Type II]